MLTMSVSWLSWMNGDFYLKNLMHGIYNISSIVRVHVLCYDLAIDKRHCHRPTLL